jgi:hypothetical protein
MYSIRPKCDNAVTTCVGASTVLAKIKFPQGKTVCVHSSLESAVGGGGLPRPGARPHRGAVRTTVSCVACRVSRVSLSRVVSRVVTCRVSRVACWVRGSF